MDPELFARFVEIKNTPIQLRTEKDSQDFVILGRALTAKVHVPCPHCGHYHTQAEAHPMWNFNVDDESFVCPHTGESLRFHINVYGLTFWSREPIKLAEAVTE